MIHAGHMPIYDPSNMRVAVSHHDHFPQHPRAVSVVRLPRGVEVTACQKERYA